jgi:hypothetical protein
LARAAERIPEHPPPVSRGTIVARVLPLLLFFVGLLIAVIARQQSMRPRSDRVYRPRANPWGFPGRTAGQAADAGAGTNWVVPRGALEGLRDAYSSAPIDPDAPLWRCGGCQACYHRLSVQALESHHAGRCALCGSDDLRPIQVV